MKISIITPSYNQGQYIEDAIQSVLQQNYPDFEHIIMDGGSTDDTVERLKKYSHLVWVSEKDKGQSDALNKGFRRATGDVIGWLNCDDFYLEGTFHKVKEAFANSGADAVYSNLYFCDEQKNITQNYRSNRTNKFLSLFHTYIPSETLFFRKEVLNVVPGVQEHLHYCMDLDFMARLLFEKFKLYYVKDAYFAVFRWQGMNKSIDSGENRKKRIEESILIYNQFVSKLWRLNPNSSFHQFLYTWMRNSLKVLRLYLKFTS